LPVDRGSPYEIARRGRRGDRTPGRPPDRPVASGYAANLPPRCVRPRACAGTKTGGGSARRAHRGRDRRRMAEGRAASACTLRRRTERRRTAPQRALRRASPRQKTHIRGGSARVRAPFPPPRSVSAIPDGAKPASPQVHRPLSYAAVLNASLRIASLVSAAVV